MAMDGPTLTTSITVSITAMTKAATSAKSALPPATLYKLMSWFSPAYPVGAYCYSHGMEQAVEEGRVADDVTAKAWIMDIIELGDGAADVSFLARSYDAARAAEWDSLRNIDATAKAFQASSELQREMTAQGRAFLQITCRAWPVPLLSSFQTACPDVTSYPVVVGVSGAAHGIERGALAHAYLHAFAANLISAAVRLVPLGQTAGQKVTADLQDTIVQTADQAGHRKLEEISNMTLMVDNASMRHETQYTRLFRS